MIEDYFSRMRRLWSALAVTAAISAGACAAGSSGTAPDPTGPGTTASDDSGPGTQENDPEDSGSPVVSNPHGDDSGQPGTGDDASSGGGGDDSAAPPSEDSGTVVVSEDSGGGGGGAAACPTVGTASNGDTFEEEWSLLYLAGVGTKCPSGPSPCSSSQCCYTPVALGIPEPTDAICVDL